MSQLEGIESMVASLDLCERSIKHGGHCVDWVFR
jgi:hypothetical protein